MESNDPDGYRMLIRSCGGSIGLATEKLGTPSSDAEKLRSQVSLLVDLLCEGKKDKILLFFVKARFTREALDSLLLMLSFAMRDLLKIKYGELSNSLYFVSNDDAENISAAFARSTLMSLYDASEILRQKLAVNVNVDAYCVHCADVLSDTARK